jgi:hypothetical protein
MRSWQALLLSGVVLHVPDLSAAQDSIGSVLLDVEGTANEIILMGQNSASDVVINAGNTLLITVNALRFAYAEQLTDTFAAIGDERAAVFRELDALSEKASSSLEDASEIVDQMGVVFGRLPLADKAPAVTSITFEPFEQASGSTKVIVRGFNVDRLPLELESPDLVFSVSANTSSMIEYNVNTSSTSSLSAKDWIENHHVKLKFAGDGWLSEEQSYTVTGHSVDTSLLEARIVYVESREERQYEETPRRIEKQQGRVGHAGLTE